MKAGKILHPAPLSEKNVSISFFANFVMGARLVSEASARARKIEGVVLRRVPALSSPTQEVFPKHKYVEKPGLKSKCLYLG